MPRYLIATDAAWILDEVRSAVEGPGLEITVCRSGRDVIRTVRTTEPDLAILDLQIGTMGGMAVTMDLRLEQTGGRLPHVPVLMLLDRSADIFLASRAGAEGWLIKPLDSLRLHRAAAIVAAGGTYYEGVPAPTAPEGPTASAPDAGAAEGASDAATMAGGGDTASSG